MEIHPDVSYEDPADPEENQWVLPSLPPPASVPDNTRSTWIFYLWSGQPNPWQRWVSIAITREIMPPWRRGMGIMFKRRQRAVAFGIWIRGKPPRILTEAPAETNWQETVSRANSLESGVERN